MADVTVALTGVQSVTQVGTPYWDGFTWDSFTWDGNIVYKWDSFTWDAFTWDQAKDITTGTTIALTGVSATGSVGQTLATSQLQSVAATGSVGTLGVSRTLAITGNASTLAAGSVASQRSRAVSGASATLLPGSVATSVTVAITGTSATCSAGSVAQGLSFQITGEQSTGAVGSVVTSRQRAITGVASTASPGNVSVYSAFPTQYSGLRTYHNGAMMELCLVSEANAPTGQGGVLKIRKNGVNYAAYLVSTADGNASPVRVRTSTGTKAIRLKT